MTRLTQPSSGLVHVRVICAVTLALGAAVLAWTLAITPGSSLFYWATAALALVWIVGAGLASRWGESGQPLEEHRAGIMGMARSEVSHHTLMGAGVGAVLVAMFLAGALVVAHIPVLRGPVETLLAHADQGSFVLVLALTMLNGVAEELFFRGALFSAFRGLYPTVATTVVYVCVTAASGIPLLALAGLLLGAVAAWLRVRTRGLAAPIATHLIWQLGMIFLLPPTFNLWS